MLAFLLLTFGYTHAGVYAVKIFDNRTGIWFDSQQPLVPQIESGMLLQKKNMSETEFKRTMENLSDASAKMVASCSSPFSELLRGLCDFSVSTVSIICKTEIAKHEIFECTNPGINQYLRKQGITDPEAHIRYWIEKMHRGEASDLFAGTLLDNSTG